MFVIERRNYWYRTRTTIMEAVRLKRILIFCLATFLVVCASGEERKIKMSNRTQNQPSLFTSSEFNPSNRTIDLAWYAPPSAKPSSAPTTTYPTKAPTFFPSASPTEAPTPIPSKMPVLPVTFTRKLQLTLSYMESPMNVLSQRVWSQVTSDFIIAFWKTNDASQSAIFVQDLNVTTIFESQETVRTTNTRRILNSGFRRRVVVQQQEKQRMQVSFIHQISYSTLLSSDSSISDDDPYTLTELISTIPFNTVESRNQYILNLQETQDVAFQSLEYASSVSPVSTFQPSQLQQQSNSSISFLQTNSTWIVGVAALVCVLVLLIGNYMFRAYKRQRHGEDSTTKESSTTASEDHVPQDVTVRPKDHNSTTDTNSVNTYLIESHLSECENMLLDLKAPEKLRASDFNVVEEFEQIVAEESAGADWPFLIGYFVDTKKDQSFRREDKEAVIVCHTPPDAALVQEACDNRLVAIDDIADDCSKADCSVLTNYFQKTETMGETKITSNGSLLNSHSSIRSKEDASNFRGVVPYINNHKVQKRRQLRLNYSYVSSKASTAPSLGSLSKNDDTATTWTKNSLNNHNYEDEEYYSGDDDRYNKSDDEEEDEATVDDSLNRRSNPDPKKKSNGITIICCGDVLFADKDDTVIL